MLTIVLVEAMVLAKLFPDTPTGKLIHRWLVELPAAQLARIERRHILFLIIALVAFQAMATIASVDLILLFAWDTTLYVEVLTAVMAMRAVFGFRIMRSAIRARIALLLAPRPGRPAPRQRRRSPRRASPSTRNDDERRAAGSVFAYA